MPYIKLTLNRPIVDGETLTFKVPTNSEDITGLKVYYVTLTEDAETTQTKIFTFKDAHGNDLTTVSDLFTTGAYIKVILDTTNNVAYIQNADTNAYLENRLSGLKAKSITLSLPASNWDVIGNQSVTVVGLTDNIIISPSPNYLDVYSSSGVRCTLQGPNYLQFHCRKKPTVDLSVEVLCL